jgi:hypothetical protein
MNQIKQTSFYLLFCSVMLGGCNFSDIKFDNLYVDEISSTYAVELGFARYSIVDLLDQLDDENLIIDSTSSDVIEIRFEIDPYTVTRKDLFEDTDILQIEEIHEIQELLPFKSLDLSASGGELKNIFGEPKGLFQLIDDLSKLPIPIILEINPEDLVDTLEIEFEADSGSLVEQIYFKGGAFNFQLKGLDFQYSLVALNMFRNSDGKPLAINQNRVESDPVSLSGYYTDFAALRSEIDPEDDSLQQMRMRLQVKDLILQPGESITNSTVVLVDVTSGALTVKDFNAIKGAFAEQHFEIDAQSIALSAMEKFTNGSIVFNNPSLEFYIESYLGLPVVLDLSKFSITTNKSPEGKNLEIYDESAGKIASVESFDPIYKNLIARKDTIRINKHTSNIVDVFAEIPTKIVFSTSATILNQPGSFATIPENDEDIFISLSGLATLPLNATISNVEQTFDFDAISSNEVRVKDTAKIILSYKNSIPLDVFAEIGFVSMQNDTTYSSQKLMLTKNVEVEDFDMTDEGDLPSAELVLTESEADKLFTSNRIIVVLKVNSPSGQDTKINTEQEIFVRVSALVGVNVNL